MTNENHGRVMFISLACSVLWLIPNPGASMDQEQVTRNVRNTAATLTGNSIDTSPFVPTVGEKVKVSMKKKDED